jgi:hypothetical protein
MSAADNTGKGKIMRDLAVFFWLPAVQNLLHTFPGCAIDQGLMAPALSMRRGIAIVSQHEKPTGRGHQLATNNIKVDKGQKLRGPDLLNPSEIRWGRLFKAL